MLGLCCCSVAFAVYGLLTAVAYLATEQGL